METKSNLLIWYTYDLFFGEKLMVRGLFFFFYLSFFGFLGSRLLTTLQL